MADYTEAIYQKFLSSQQATVRLTLALDGFFAEEGFTPQQQQAFADYLKLRIRPALQSMIVQEDIDRIQRVDTLGWLSASVVEEGLSYAIAQKKTQSFLCLLKSKAKNYGFPDRNLEW